jgi:hypothetical protein
MGNKKRFMFPDPVENEVLPVDDTAWDEGAMSRAGQRNISEPFSEPHGPFARLCEAAILAGRALVHVRAAKTRQRAGQAIDATSADGLLASLENATAVLANDVAANGSLPAVALGYTAAQCVVFSSLILIYDFYCCPGNVHDPTERPRTASERDMQPRAVDELHRIAERVHEIARHVFGYARENGDVSVVSPLVLDAMYCAASTFDWLIRESGESSASESLGGLKRCITRLSLRWRLGAEYLKMLEQQDIALMLVLKGTPS